jgi:6-phosphogluconolactonase
MTALAGHWVAAAAKAIEARGRFCVALAGGSTPRGLYARLAGADFAGRVDWDRVYVFFGDERCVPPGDAQSNYRMAQDSLLTHVPLAPVHVFRLRGEDTPERAAEDYELGLRRFFGTEDGPPAFDLVLLGLGADGHTASLFPGTPALEERSRWVAAVKPAGPGPWRLSLTLPVINAAREIAFLVAGEGKTEVLATLLEGGARAQALPAQGVRAAHGETRFWVDADAAARLEPYKPNGRPE